VPPEVEIIPVTAMPPANVLMVTVPGSAVLLPKSCSTSLASSGACHQPMAQWKRPLLQQEQHAAFVELGM
jgi:hypothetical protein